MYRYKQVWLIEQNPKPIPDQRHDWDWWHEDVCGPQDFRFGTGATPADCIRQIDELEEE